jgi:hypothetical protein
MGQAHTHTRTIFFAIRQIWLQRKAEEERKNLKKESCYIYIVWQHVGDSRKMISLKSGNFGAFCSQIILCMSEWWHWISFESPIGKTFTPRKKERKKETSAPNLH